MKPFLYHFFHHETNDRAERGMVQVPKDETLWPADWKTIHYKNYPLTPSIALPQVSGSPLQDMLTKRTSQEGREKSAPIALPKLARILHYGYGLRDKGGDKRTVPSAGAHYPLEVYVFIFEDRTGASLPSGIYHYDVRGHALELVKEKTFTEAERRRYASYDWLLAKNVMICLTGVFDRTIGQYGSRGYRYMLLEAGHVAQNMLLAGAEVGTQGVPIGGVNESVVEREMGIASSQEKILYTLFF